jgi:hypothetical protein
MIYTYTETYVLKWQLRSSPEYKWAADCGTCFNTRTGNKIKMILNGRSKGYCINGKFISLNKLRPQLELIPKIDTPF